MNIYSINKIIFKIFGPLAGSLLFGAYGIGNIVKNFYQIPKNIELYNENYFELRIKDKLNSYNTFFIEEFLSLDISRAETESFSYTNRSLGFFSGFEGKVFLE